MSVKNLSRNNDEEIESAMSITLGVDIKTLQTLRKKNIIPRSYYRCVDRGRVGRSDCYFYNKSMMIELMEKLRYDGTIKKRRTKRKKVRF